MILSSPVSPPTCGHAGVYVDVSLYENGRVVVHWYSHRLAV